MNTMRILGENMAWLLNKIHNKSMEWKRTGEAIRKVWS
jgi:hypothetical protein